MFNLRIVILNKEKRISPYNEFEQLLSEYFQQKMIRQIKLAYVDESTIQVSAVVKIKLKVAEATIPVKEKVSVKMVADSDITLTHAGMAFDLKWEQVLELCEDVVKDMLEVQDNHTVLVHLDKIDKLNTILEKVEMQSISFEPEYINLCFALK